MSNEQFEELFSAHFPSLRNYLYYRCGDPEIASDLAQEAFMKLWEKKDKIDLSNTVGLLYKISLDLWISKVRHQKVQKKYSAFIEEVDYHTPEDEADYQALVQSYEKALEEMPDNQREVFLMSRHDALKYNEISERLGIGVKAVEKRMKNALAFLRSALNYEKRKK
ncbi:RNA polymerase sigma factor [Halosquirtibacter laminarini]|uniref:RNA polymerase sigma factor n=1 Tax=Halosquirtibacter laminarini TaxID=3374600 RepID=A0AC61NMW4_9BACT|nr:RNA polymerase sigma factor [Prolixibacteraceae bacterium]